MSKPKGKIRVRFIGKNATDVTGSCTVIEYCDKKILIECGLYQGGTDLEQYNINKNLSCYAEGEVSKSYNPQTHTWGKVSPAAYVGVKYTF